MSERLNGRVAFITGAARRRGIGRATALRLADEGADIVCVDIARQAGNAPTYAVGSVEELDEVVEAIEAKGRRALAVRADVTILAEMSAAVEHGLAAFGRLDICCAMAGGVGFGNGIAPLVRLTEPEWDWVVDLNLKGTWITTKVCAAAMIDTKTKGRIVTCASGAGLTAANGTTGMGAYAAAKAGVIVLTQSLARELGPYGINVNAVTPGMIKTQASAPVFGHLESRGRLDGVLDTVPLRRMAEPEEIAAVVAFLCSDDASFVTGAAINATGGQVLG